MKLADITVELMDSMGSDATVANVARVSFAKEVKSLQDQDVRLIKYLAKHGHWSPFAHCFLQFRIKAPLCIAAQLKKHQVGLSWNEVSRRYVSDEPEFYQFPMRLKPEGSIKQGSSAEVLDHPMVNAAIRTRYEDCLNTYTFLIERGVAPECARSILPQGAMTEWIWSGSLMAFARVCMQRLDNHAQVEAQLIAEQIAEQIDPLFPHSFAALLAN
jgi:thymidylate synthase (FAD)